jgi:tetratricopeptide (TPR) repeat protein
MLRRRRWQSLARFRYAAWYLLPFGKIAEASEQCQLALKTDPLNFACQYGVGSCLLHAQRYADVIEHARKALDIDANSYLMWRLMGRAQLHAVRPQS